MNGASTASSPPPRWRRTATCNSACSAWVATATTRPTEALDRNDDHSRRKRGSCRTDRPHPRLQCQPRPSNALVSDVPAARIEAQARTISRPTLATSTAAVSATCLRSLPARRRKPHVIVAGTLDTKGEELRYIRDIIKGGRIAHAAGRPLSTNGRNQGADVSAQEVALASPRASAGIASGDRGRPSPQ